MQAHKYAKCDGKDADANGSDMYCTNHEDESECGPIDQPQGLEPRSFFLLLSKGSAQGSLLGDKALPNEVIEPSFAPNVSPLLGGDIVEKGLCVGDSPNAVDEENEAVDAPKLG